MVITYVFQTRFVFATIQADSTIRPEDVKKKKFQQSILL